MKKEKKSFIEKAGGIINLFGNAVLMNVLFLAACLPIVTIGQAWCGLLGAIRYNIRGEKWFEGFKMGFKKRFWRGTIIWCLGLVLCMTFLWDINGMILQKSGFSAMVVPGLMFLLVASVVQSALLLNVYIYTNVNNWIKNMVNLTFRGLIPMVLCTAFFWLPAVVTLLVDISIMIEFLMALLLAYFTVIALVETMAMKGNLLEILLDCRADGLIIEEEGVAPIVEESGDEE